MFCSGIYYFKIKRKSCPCISRIVKPLYKTTENPYSKVLFAYDKMIHVVMNNIIIKGINLTSCCYIKLYHVIHNKWYMCNSMLLYHVVSCYFIYIMHKYHNRNTGGRINKQIQEKMFMTTNR